VTTKYYLVIDGIAGDSVDQPKLLTGAFQVNGFSLATADLGSLALGARPTTFQPLSLSLNSQSVAGLLAAEASGQSIKDASLVGVSTDSTGKAIITYSLNLSNVNISNVSEANGPGINLTLDYSRIGLVTTALGGTGLPQPSQSFGWDLAENRSVGPGTTLTSAGHPSVAPTAPTKYYLLIDGLNGDALDKGHTGWFNLSGFNINLANTSDPLQPGTGGKDVFSALSVTTGGQTDLTALLQLEAEGKGVTGLRVEGVDSTGQAVYDLNLADVLITGVNDQNDGSLGLSFDYKEVSLVTKGQDPSGGGAGTDRFVRLGPRHEQGDRSEHDAEHQPRGRSRRTWTDQLLPRHRRHCRQLQRQAADRRLQGRQLRPAYLERWLGADEPGNNHLRSPEPGAGQQHGGGAAGG